LEIDLGLCGLGIQRCWTPTTTRGTQEKTLRPEGLSYRTKPKTTGSSRLRVNKAPHSKDMETGLKLNL